MPFYVTFVLPTTSLVLKKRAGCSHVIYNVRNIIEHYTNNGSTVSVCSLDLSKAFDRMNHCALFIKLTERKLPNEILSILERWFDISVTRVKWNGHVSHFSSIGWRT